MKILGVALMLVAAGALAGCADDATQTTTTPADTSTTAATPTSTSATTTTPTTTSTAWKPASTSASLSGTGATFPAPLITKWSSEYNKITGAQVNYQGIGSGGGIKAITDKTVDFAGSDAPLTEAQRAAAPGLLHIPETLGAVVVVYNVAGVDAGLKLTGELVAQIFMGSITKWNDPAIAALNPGVSLPNADIVVAHRSDGSGTTFAFTDYLSRVSTSWANGPGKGTSVNWPVGVGGKGNDGVAGVLAQQPNTIGYVELAYAKLNNLKTAQMKNKAGNFVSPSLETTSAAAAGAVNSLPNAEDSWSTVSIANADGANAWPIATFTYILIYKDLSAAYGDKLTQAEAKALLDFLWWIVHDGQVYGPTLDYPALPTPVVTLNEAALGTITYNGQRVFTGAPVPAPKPAAPAWKPASTSASLSGTGATFPAPLITKWSSEYNKITGAQVNYQGIGSGGGIKAITDKTVDFAGSDAPLTEAQRANATGLLHIPETLGAVVVVYNVAGIEAGLKLTGTVVADIFLGTITKWNDPAIAALNPGVSLPNADIVVAHRSDGSGTTFAFTDYLSRVSTSWANGPGKGTSVNWPVGVGGKGNDGVAGVLAQQPNTIGYVELAYAKLNDLDTAAIQNKAGNFVTPSLESTSAAAAGAINSLPAADASWSTVSVANADGANAWPIATFTYILVYKDLSGAYGDKLTQAEAKALLDFLWWIVHDGQVYGPTLDYPALPGPVVKLNEDALRSITYGGQRVFSA